MGCFCHASPGLLEASLGLPGGAVVSLPALPTAASLAMELAAWLANRGIPGPLWRPQGAWLSLNLPAPGLSAAAGGTILVLVQARAQIQATFGLDMLVAADVRAMARIVATLNARAGALAGIAAALGPPQPWLQVAALNASLDQILQALAAGMIPRVGVQAAVGYMQPGGIALDQWASFVAGVQALMPTVSIAAHLGIDLAQPDAVGRIAAAVRALAGVSMQAFAAAGAVASLTATASALARLQASLGVQPLRLGLDGVLALVLAKLEQVGPQLPPSLPAMPPSASRFITADLVALLGRLDAGALARMNWAAPSMLSLSLVASALPAASFVAAANAWIGASGTVGAEAALTVRATPCGSGCDAALVMKAMEQALA